MGEDTKRRQMGAAAPVLARRRTRFAKAATAGGSERMPNWRAPKATRRPRIADPGARSPTSDDSLPAVLQQDILELLGHVERLVEGALPDVATEDEAGGARFHRLARLLQQRLVAHLLPAAEDHQRLARALHHPRRRLLLGRVQLAVRLRLLLVLLRVHHREVELDDVGPDFER